MNIYFNCITGHFINFAICEYYSDDTFGQLSTFTLRAIMGQTYQEIKVSQQMRVNIYI